MDGWVGEEGRTQHCWPRRWEGVRANSWEWGQVCSKADPRAWHQECPSPECPTPTPTPAQGRGMSATGRFTVRVLWGLNPLMTAGLN